MQLFTVFFERPVEFGLSTLVVAVMILIMLRAAMSAERRAGSVPDTILPAEAVAPQSALLANTLLLGIIVTFLMAGALRKAPVYETFIEGAKEGLGFSTMRVTRRACLTLSTTRSSMGRPAISASNGR